MKSENVTYLYTVVTAAGWLVSYITSRAFVVCYCCEQLRMFRHTSDEEANACESKRRTFVRGLSCTLLLCCCVVVQTQLGGSAWAADCVEIVDRIGSSGTKTASEREHIRNSEMLRESDRSWLRWKEIHERASNGTPADRYAPCQRPDDR